MNDLNPEDNAQSRFAARVMIVIALLAFVVAISVVFCISRSGEVLAENKVEDGRAEGRLENLAKVMKEQQALVGQAAVVDQAKNLVRIPVKEGMKLVLPALKSKKAGATKVLVPGSPTQLKQSQAAGAAAKANDAKVPEKKAGAETKTKAPEKK